MVENAVQRKTEISDVNSMRSGIQSELDAILTGEAESEVFWKTMLEQITVFKDRHLELRLNLLPHVFRFI